LEFVQPIRDKKKIDIMKKILMSNSLRNYCLFTLGINSGLRISDLLKLKISDVLDEGGKIRERITLREKKTNKTKNFPISEVARKAIGEYLKTRIYDINEPFFLSQKTKNGKISLQRDQAYKIINNAARSIGIKERIGTHTLRKTFGYHAYQAGVSIEVIQKLFNHSAPSITLRYIGITQDDMDNVYLNLNL
jgi:integrase